MRYAWQAPFSEEKADSQTSGPSWVHSISHNSFRRWCGPKHYAHTYIQLEAVGAGSDPNNNCVISSRLWIPSIMYTSCINNSTCVHYNQLVVYHCSVVIYQNLVSLMQMSLNEALELVVRSDDLSSVGKKWIAFCWDVTSYKVVTMIKKTIRKSRNFFQ